MFDPWRLRTLRELALRGTMAAVAEELTLTPSAVSQQLASLERDAGVALIEPEGRGVRLTNAGRSLAAHAEIILNAIQSAADDISDLNRDVTGYLRLASFPTAAAAICPPVINRLQELYPRHTITLVDLEPPTAMAALIHGDVDLAIVDALALPEAGQGSKVEPVELFADPLYCLLPEEHPAARRKAIKVSDMRDQHWIMEDPTSSFFRLTVDLCQRAGFQPTVIANCRSFKVVTALVRAGCGISIQPGLGLIGEHDVAFRPLKPAVYRTVYAVHRNGSGSRPSIAAAIELLREVAASLAPVPAEGLQRRQVNTAD